MEYLRSTTKNRARDLLSAWSAAWVWTEVRKISGLRQWVIWSRFARLVGRNRRPSNSVFASAVRRSLILMGFRGFSCGAPCLLLSASRYSNGTCWPRSESHSSRPPVESNGNYETVFRSEDPNGGARECSWVRLRFLGTDHSVNTRINQRMSISPWWESYASRRVLEPDVSDRASGTFWVEGRCLPFRSRYEPASSWTRGTFSQNQHRNSGLVSLSLWIGGSMTAARKSRWSLFDPTIKETR